MKLKADIIYIKSCKKEELIPTFGKVNLTINSGGFKIKKNIDNGNRNTRQTEAFKKDTKRYSIISDYREINSRCDFVRHSNSSG